MHYVHRGFAPRGHLTLAFFPGPRTMLYLPCQGIRQGCRCEECRWDSIDATSLFLEQLRRKVVRARSSCRLPVIPYHNVQRMPYVGENAVGPSTTSWLTLGRVSRFAS